MAVILGATHTVNPKKVDVEKEIFKVTPFGVNHTIGAVGSVPAFDNALNVLAPGGNFIILGAPSHGDHMTIDTTARILTGERGIRGSKYGSSNPAIEFPMLIELYLVGKLNLDSLLTRTYNLDESNKAFEVLAKGGSGRGLIRF
jgi:S-(hydroxymethyl)glutathione dehydrogenase/alcohol dehydrogenase